MLKFPILTPLGIESAAKMTDFFYIQPFFPVYYAKRYSPGTLLPQWCLERLLITCGVSLHQDSSDKVGIIK